MAEPVHIQPRGLSREQAATYCGLSVEGFDDWRRKKFVPEPMPGTHRWDRKALDMALDKLSGIPAESAPRSALREWKEKRNARQA